MSSLSASNDSPFRERSSGARVAFERFPLAFGTFGLSQPADAPRSPATLIRCRQKNPGGNAWLRAVQAAPGKIPGYTKVRLSDALFMVEAPGIEAGFRVDV